MELTIKCKVKICLWYKAVIKLTCMLVKVRLMKLETAVKVLCKLSGKGCKYKIGNSKWIRINRNFDYEIVAA